MRNSPDIHQVLGLIALVFFAASATDAQDIFPAFATSNYVATVQNAASIPGVRIESEYQSGPDLVYPLTGQVFSGGSGAIMLPRDGYSGAVTSRSDPWRVLTEWFHCIVTNDMDRLRGLYTSESLGSLDEILNDPTVKSQWQGTIAGVQAANVRFSFVHEGVLSAYVDLEFAGGEIFPMPYLFKGSTGVYHMVTQLSTNEVVMDTNFGLAMEQGGASALFP